MLFYGEGVEQDYDLAHEWFHSAADQGHLQAQRNLGFMHSLAIPGIPAHWQDAEEANLWLSLASTGDPTQTNSALVTKRLQGVLSPIGEESESTGTEFDRGERIFMRHCAGCHGFDGIAAYPDAPSFAAGERLGKKDAELLESIREGKDLMPAWGETLGNNFTKDALVFIRTQFGSISSFQAEKKTRSTTTRDPQIADDGEYIFLAFCSGCHGRNGVSYYVNSPSFALGERLHKTDSTLMDSILNGLGAMPSWGEIITRQQAHEILTFIRTLQPTFEKGITSGIRNAPELYYHFRPLGERGGEWKGADPIGVIPE